MRTMRWAAVLSADDRPRLAALGVAELEALLDSDLLEESEKTFVEAALGAVYEVPEKTLDHLGEEAEAVLGDERTATDRGTSEIPSITDHPEDRGDQDG